MKKVFLLLLLALMGTAAFAADAPSSGVFSQSSGLAALKPASAPKLNSPSIGLKFRGCTPETGKLRG